MEEVQVYLGILSIPCFQVNMHFILSFCLKDQRRLIFSDNIWLNEILKVNTISSQVRISKMLNNSCFYSKDQSFLVLEIPAFHSLAGALDQVLRAPLCIETSVKSPPCQAISRPPLGFCLPPEWTFLPRQHRQPPLLGPQLLGPPSHHEGK